MIEKIFKAYDVRATYPNPLNEEMAWKVGHATAQFLKRSRQSIPDDQRVKQEDTIVIGRDMRPSSPDLAKALSEGIRSVGFNVIDVADAESSDFTSTVVRYEYATDGARTVTAAIPGSSRVKRAGLGTTVEVVVGDDWQGVERVVVKKPPASGVRTANQNICKTDS